MGRKKATPPPDIRELLTSKSTVDQAMLLGELMEALGGVKALAQEMVHEYQQSRPGSMSRQKMLQMIQWLIVSTTQREMAQTLDAPQRTDEELQEAQDLLVEKLAHAVKEAGVVSAATAGTEEAAGLGTLEAGPDDAYAEGDRGGPVQGLD